MCHDNEERCKIWRWIDLSIQNWHDEFNGFWPKHLKVSKIVTLMGCLWPKNIMLELKKCRGVIFNSTEDCYKIRRKTYLLFQKWSEEFGKFLPEHSKVSKLGLLWDPFIQSIKYMSLKFSGDLCFITMNIDARFEGKLICALKDDMRNLANFHILKKTISF